MKLKYDKRCLIIKGKEGKDYQILNIATRNTVSEAQLYINDDLTALRVEQFGIRPRFIG